MGRKESKWSKWITKKEMGLVRKEDGTGEGRQDRSKEGGQKCAEWDGHAKTNVWSSVSKF